MYKEKNLSGQRFGKLIVIRPLGYIKPGDRHFWSEVKCDCGEIFNVQDTLLVCGRKKQCPKCSLDERKTHGMTNTPLYHTWQSMRARCNRKTCQDYYLYGARGISVCDEWNTSFESFRDWALANGYQENLSIDRIDVNGNYEPSNCRWADDYTQARNRRDTVYVVFDNKKISVQEVSEITGIGVGTILNRIKHGWSDYDATHIRPSSYEAYTKTPFSGKRRGVTIKNLVSGGETYFDSCSDASIFLGFNKGYLLTKAKRENKRDFMVGDCYVRIEEHCHKL